MCPIRPTVLYFGTVGQDEHTIRVIAREYLRMQICTWQSHRIRLIRKPLIFIHTTIYPTHNIYSFDEGLEHKNVIYTQCDNADYWCTIQNTTLAIW